MKLILELAEIKIGHILTVLKETSESEINKLKSNFHLA